MEDHSDDEMDDSHQHMVNVRNRCIEREIILVMKDLNAKIGENHSINVVKISGLGVKNEAGDEWAEW